MTDSNLVSFLDRCYPFQRNSFEVALYERKRLAGQKQGVIAMAAAIKTFILENIYSFVCFCQSVAMSRANQ